MEDFDLQSWIAEHSDADVLERLLDAGALRVSGVPRGALAELAREWSRRHDWKTAANSLGNTYEEAVLQAMVYGEASKGNQTTLKWLARFLKQVDNVPLCDATALACSFAVRRPDETLEFVTSRLNDTAPFIQRFAIMVLMDHYMTGDRLNRTLELYGTVKPHSPEAEQALVKGYTAAFLNSPARTREALLHDRRPADDFNRLLDAMLQSPRLTPPLQETLAEIKR